MNSRDQSLRGMSLRIIGPKLQGRKMRRRIFGVTDGTGISYAVGKVAGFQEIGEGFVEEERGDRMNETAFPK